MRKMHQNGALMRLQWVGSVLYIFYCLALFFFPPLVHRGAFKRRLKDKIDFFLISSSFMCNPVFIGGIYEVKYIC